MSNDHIRTFADGTFLAMSPFPFSCGYRKARALMPNGELRRVTFSGDGIPDTFYSIPGRVSWRGRKVRGYATLETRDGFSTQTPDDPYVVKFIPYDGQGV